MATMTEFEQSVVAEVKRVREIIAHTDLVNSFEFNIMARGRALDGEVEIRFVVELNYDRAVESNSIEGALLEALRRCGWQKTNAPLCLSAVTADEEIPF